MIKLMRTKPVMGNQGEIQGKRGMICMINKTEFQVQLLLH